jgi:hypothetical protein
MRKTIKYLTVIILIFGAAILASVYYSDEIVHWKFISVNESPNKEFLASVYAYGSDGDGHAPYGTYVFLKQSLKPLRVTKGHVIFAGYCENEVTLVWLSNTELNIKCKLHRTEAVRTLSSIAYGISVKFVPE